MFELEPECISMFGFPEDTKHDDPSLSENDKFIKKGIALIVAVDIALTFLGPDLEPLEGALLELGGRHVARLCKPKHWPMVGVALLWQLPAHGKITGRVLVAVLVLVAIGRVRRAWFENEYYRFTTWRWGKPVIMMMAVAWAVRLLDTR